MTPEPAAALDPAQMACLLKVMRARPDQVRRLLTDIRDGLPERRPS